MNSRDPILLVNPEAELYRRFTPREAARIQSFPDEFLLNDSEPKSYKPYALLCQCPAHHSRSVVAEGG